MSAARYFLTLPKQFYASSNKDDVKKTNLNDETPLKRKRSQLNKKRTGSSDSNRTKFPYPSSFYYTVFYQNTVEHPYLIFFNLDKFYKETPQGETYPKKFPRDKDIKSIISDLNSYFGVSDILSYSSPNVDINEVSKTWNKRFPYAKSTLFSQVQDDFIVKDLLDIQSLHFLGFKLNTSIFLIFCIDTNKKTFHFNMKLGPDFSDHDIHYFVYENVDKSASTVETRRGDKITIYKDDKWLSFQRLEIGKLYNDDINTKEKLISDKGGVLFLEMEKRDPIPIIQLPSFKEVDNNETEIKKVAYIKHEVSDKDVEHSNVSFSLENEEIKIDVLYDAKSKNKLEINKINKIKCITTRFAKDNQEEIQPNNQENSDQSNDRLIANMNKSACFVVKKNLEVNNLEIDEIKNLNFAIIKGDECEDCITSYRERLKYPLTYGNIVDSKHPLIDYLCYDNIIQIMIKSADYLNQDLGIAIPEHPTLRVFPIENNDIFFSYKKFEDVQIQSIRERSTGNYSLVPVNESVRIPDITKEWKLLTNTYPQLMASSAHTSDNNTLKHKDKFNCEDSPLFGQFMCYIIEVVQSYALDHSKKYINIARRAISDIENSSIGLNPIVAPVIKKEFLEMSKICCIHYFGNRRYNSPINDQLTRGIRSIKEFQARTTVKYFESEDVVKRNAEKGAFPIKKQTFIESLEMKRNKQIPDPSFAFKKNMKGLYEIATRMQKCKTRALRNRYPKFQYQFFDIHETSIDNISKFSLHSQYLVRYFYVTRGNVYCVGQVNDLNKYVYGSCKTKDTEIKFKEPADGKFTHAVYLEDDSCLIVCVNIGPLNNLLVGYDKQGVTKELKLAEIGIKNAQKLVVISRTYFALYEDEKLLHVFKYDPKERQIIYGKYADNWRIKENALCSKYLQLSVNKPNMHYFIGSQNSYGSDDSSICVYRFNPANKNIYRTNPLPNKNCPRLNICLESDIKDESYSLIPNDQNEDENENELLDNRINNPKIKVSIPSMLNCLPVTKKKNSSFSIFDLHCSLCELFPAPVAINGRIIHYCNGMLSFYLLDYKIYRLLSHQIFGFYKNTYERITLFATEALLSLYPFNYIQVTLIVDTYGIGAKFSNLFYGTKFNEKEIHSEDIWSGFSYSESLATIILLFRVSGTDNIYNALLNMPKREHPSIFVCKKAGVNQTIKFGYNTSLIPNNFNSNFTSKIEISFINNLELSSQISDFRQKVFTDTDENEMHIISKPDDALKLSKKIIARYLSFRTFVNCPINTIEKYSVDSIEDNGFNFPKQE